jgi:hypothetical protein
MTLYSEKGRGGQVHFLHLLQALAKISLDRALIWHYNWRKRALTK